MWRHGNELIIEHALHSLPYSRNHKTKDGTDLTTQWEIFPKTPPFNFIIENLVPSENYLA